LQFRAGFEHLVHDENICEVDAPGLTTPNLANVEWRDLPRPVYPIDNDAGWTPEDLARIRHRFTSSR
jgi:microcystin degradation protein MlrC